MHDKKDMDDTAAEAFRARWSAFMEGGWEKLLAKDAERVEAVRRYVFTSIPTHPQAVSFGDLLARSVADIGATQTHLMAALLEMERHGHACLIAGWIFRPPPRVPRRGLCVEDMYFKFGCQEVSPDRELTQAEPRGTLRP